MCGRFRGKTGLRDREGGRLSSLWLDYSCPPPGLNCPKEKKSRQKRNVNFQKAISEKCTLWVPMEHRGHGGARVGAASLPSADRPLRQLRKLRAEGRGRLVQPITPLTALQARVGGSRAEVSVPPTGPASPGPAVGQYSSPDTRRCCQDGMTKLPMARTCEQRAARVPQLACREPFLSCCKFAENLRRNQTRSQAGLARGEQPGEAERWAVMPERAIPPHRRPHCPQPRKCCRRRT